jgi:hypothetical protein
LQGAKSGELGEWGASHVVSCQKFPGEKGSVRRCVVVMQQPVLLVAKVQGEVFAHFHAVALKRHSSMRN